MGGRDEDEDEDRKKDKGGGKINVRETTNRLECFGPSSEERVARQGPEFSTKRRGLNCLQIINDSLRVVTDGSRIASGHCPSC